MKKFLKITGVVLLVLLALLIVLPFAFQGKIMKLVKDQLNNNLNAKADFGRISLSVFRSFPQLTAGIRDLYIAGISDFEGDTLFSVASVEVSVDLISAMGMKNIRIKKIIINEPRIHAWVMPDGRVNWDIAKETGEDTPEDTTETTTPKIELRRFEINRAMIRYDDDSSNIHASLNDFNFGLSGNLASDFTTLAMKSETNSVNVSYGGIRYLRNAKLTLQALVDADLKNSRYTLKDNSLGLNELVFRLNGTIMMPNDSDIEVDLAYGLDKAEFKSLLSLIPAIYMRDFAAVQTAGQLKIDGNVKGTYNQKVMPSAHLDLLVEKARFKYPDLPKSAENIGIEVKVSYDGVQPDNTTVDINKFHVDLGGNPVDLTLNIKSPMSDMHVNGNLALQIDLASLNDVVPLDSTTLAGKIDAGLDFMGFMSYIENEEYEKFKADGNLNIIGFTYSSPDLPSDLQIKETALSFSPRYVEVKNFDAVMGKSDFRLTGRMENFIPYVFKDETLFGSFVFTSGVLDLNEFMSGSEETSIEEDTATLSVIEVPANVDFKLVSRIDKLYYDKLEIENTIGTILVKDARVLLDGLKLNLLGGSMQLSGEYNTREPKNPLVDFDFRATEIDVPAAFEAFSTLQQFAPVARKAVGRVSIGMKYTSYLNESMMPVLNSIVGRGNIGSSVVGLKSSDTFEKIGDALKTNAFDNMTLNNLGINFEIRDGRLIVEPFETKIGKGSLVIGGSQGLDETMNYTLGITIPRSELGAAANQPIDNLLGKAQSAGLKIDPLENLNLAVKVGGTFRDPKIGIDMRENSKKAAEQIKEQLIQTVQEEVDKKKEEARAAARAEADKLMAEAQKQADAIRQKAAEAADLVRKEAQTNGENLVKKAKDPISKKIAEEGARKLKQEGENSARKIISEADTKANAILNEAKSQADRLLE